MNSPVKIRTEAIDHMVRLAAGTPAEECCGLLAGREEVILNVLPAVNAAAASATAYEIEPTELFRLMREIRAQALDFMGIYHSHPKGTNRPSETDIGRAYYPDAAYFILSPQPDATVPVRAFSIRDGKVAELQIEILR